MLDRGPTTTDIEARSTPSTAMPRSIDGSARVVDSTVGASEVREYVTIHDSEIGDGCQIYERTSIKKSRIDNDVDVNAGTYVENARLGSTVQIGPNSSVVGVTHELTPAGMTFRADRFDRIRLHEGVFVGAGSVVSPGVEVGAGTVISAGATVLADVAAGQVVVGSPPGQRIVAIDEWLDG
jgi:acetyltransferase-like isoleucine patch superfamily enzyme